MRLETPDGTETVFSRDTEGTTGLHTEEEDLSAFDGETVSIEVEKGGNASIWVDDVRLFVDSDADGLSDNEEREGFRVGWGETVPTDVHDTDTDDDDLTDREEVRYRYNHLGHTYFIVNSNPNSTDSDQDGLKDEPETDPKGVKLNVFSKSVNIDGTTYTGPYRWDPDKNNDEVTIETHPLNPDSDGDGLADGTEQNEYHSRADRKISYNITRVHQDRIVDPLVDANNVEKLETLGLLTSRDLRDLETDGLTDATDDFDLVTADDGSLVFTALDRTDRTDTWLSNREEISIGTDPWDPDHDDDGLTDGQEAKWLTTAEEVRFRTGPVPDVTRYEVDRGELIGTNATKNDTDGDGYWDGWIGVHGVGHSDNVVLYMEHLRDEDMGIQSDEIVQEQTETHTWNGKERSSVHLGELHWGTNPRERADNADEQTSLTVEVDYVEGRDPRSDSQNGVNILDAVERNFELYGLNVTFEVNEELSEDELSETCKAITVFSVAGYSLYSPCPSENPPNAVNVTPEEFNRWELDVIEDKYHDDPDSMHMLWGTNLSADVPKTEIDERIGPRYENASAVAFTNGAPRTDLLDDVSFKDFGVFVARDEYGQSEYDSLQSVILHETGHALSAGWADDDPVTDFGVFVPNGLEAYSGDVNGQYVGVDETPEEIGGKVQWSIMMRGEADDFSMSTTPRYAFSVEELSTIDFEHVPSRDN